MNSSVLRRLNCNFIYFKTFKKNFCTIIQEQPKNEEYLDVIYKKHNSDVFEIILNQPKKLNSLDLRMIKSMLKYVRKWVPENIHTTGEEDNSHGQTPDEPVPKVLLISGNGKNFCAGGDIKALYNARKVDSNTKPLKDFFRYEYILDYTLSRIDPVLISFWNGYVFGGGVGLSINAPIRIATDSTVFGMPETAIGLFPDVGGTWFLPRLFNNDPLLGLYMGLTGEKLKGIELVKCGVATHYVKQENFEKLKETLIQNVNEQMSLNDILNLLKQSADQTYDAENFDFPNYNEIQNTFTIDNLDEIFKKLELMSNDGSEEEQKWAKKVLNLLNKMSPISLAVTLEQVKRGLELKSIEEAFNLEAQLVSGFMEDSDFFEGVRAILVDKDNNPKWKYNSFRDFKHEDIVAKYFDRTEQIEINADEDVEK